MLHLSSEVPDPEHLLPPAPGAGLLQVLYFTLVPDPQVFEQSDQEVQDPHLPSTNKKVSTEMESIFPINAMLPLETELIVTDSFVVVV